MFGKSYDYNLKMLLIGESGVGKTCILLRFTNDSFSSNPNTTIGIDFKQKQIQIEDKIAKIQVWDTAGQERFKTLTKSYYKIANGIILVYDVTNIDSFRSIQTWLKQVELHSEQNVCKVIVGNKSEDNSNRKITYEQGEKFSLYHNIPFFEVSAKTGEKIPELFNFLTKIIIERDKSLLEPESNSDSGKISLSNKDFVKKPENLNEVSSACSC